MESCSAVLSLTRLLQCDAEKPACGRCLASDLECEYEIQSPGRIAALKEENIILQHEVAELKALFDFVQNRPDEEAMEIFRRIRVGFAPSAILHHIKQAELLLQNTSRRPLSRHVDAARDGAASHLAVLGVPAIPALLLSSDSSFSS